MINLTMKIFLLQQHYEKNHKINVNKYFDKNLFKRQRGTFFPNKCIKCGYFYLNSKDKKRDFLEFYQQGGRQLFKARLINIRRFDENLTYYSISFNEHSHSYNLYDVDGMVSNFLNLFSVKFVPNKKVYT